MLRTRFTEESGIEHPIVQGGMMWVGRAELVDLDAGSWTAGLAQRLIRDIPTCVELISRMVGEAEVLIRQRLADFVVALPHPQVRGSRCR